VVNSQSGAVSYAFNSSNGATTPAAAGTVLIDGTGSQWNAPGGFSIGVSGLGSVTVSNGGSLNGSSGLLFIGSATGGNGSLTIESGATATATYGELGFVSGSAGTLTVTGTGSSATFSNDLNIAYAGFGTVNVASGGSLSVGSGGVTVGVGTNDAVGTLLVQGSGSTASITGDLDTDGNEGIVFVNNGGNLSCDNAYLGTGTNSLGDASVLNGARWSVGGDLVIGQYGYGTLSVESGGMLSVAGDLDIAQQQNSVGTFIIDGASTTFTFGDGNPTVGDAGAGSMTVQDNAFVLMLSGGTFTVGNQSTGQGTLYITGGSDLAVLALDVGESGQGTATVDTASTLSCFESTAIGDAQGGSGTVTITGAGTIWNTSAVTVGGRGNRIADHFRRRGGQCLRFYPVSGCGGRSEHGSRNRDDHRQRFGAQLLGRHDRRQRRKRNSQYCERRRAEYRRRSEYRLAVDGKRRSECRGIQAAPAPSASWAAFTSVAAALALEAAVHFRSAAEQ
jgi:T5SS/PEP-CTERM-associated repeat protein